MGLGQNGGIRGHATITFDESQYTWIDSDLHCVGPYELDGDEIVATMKAPCQFC